LALEENRKNPIIVYLRCSNKKPPACGGGLFLKLFFLRLAAAILKLLAGAARAFFIWLGRHSPHLLQVYEHD